MGKIILVHLGKQSEMIPPMVEISPEEWKRWRGNEEEKPMGGYPLYYSYLDDRGIGIFPAPDYEGFEMIVRYYPPAVEV